MDEDEEEDNNKFQPGRMTSLEDKSKERSFSQTITNHQYFSDSKPQNRNPPQLKSSTSDDISSLAKKFKQQR